MHFRADSKECERGRKETYLPDSALFSSIISLSLPGNEPGIKGPHASILVLLTLFILTGNFTSQSLYFLQILFLQFTSFEVGQYFRMALLQRYQERLLEIFHFVYRYVTQQTFGTQIDNGYLLLY